MLQYSGRAKNNSFLCQIFTVHACLFCMRPFWNSGIPSGVVQFGSRLGLTRHFAGLIWVLSLSLYCLTLSCEYYGQVYFVHSGLQDENLQVTISKLP